MRTHRQIVDEIDIKIRGLNFRGSEVNFNINGRAYFIQSKIELNRLFSALHQDSFRSYDSEELELISQELYMEYGQHSVEYDNEFRIHVERIAKQYTLDFYSIVESEFIEFQTMNTTERIQFVYHKYFHRFGYAVGHYFRNLYHIFLFLEKSHNERLKLDVNSKKNDEINSEFNNYAKFIQAQLNIPELFVLFYNSFNYPKAKELLIKYQVLDVLPKTQLLFDEHQTLIPEFNLHDS